MTNFSITSVETKLRLFHAKKHVALSVLVAILKQIKNTVNYTKKPHAQYHNKLVSVSVVSQ